MAYSYVSLSTAIQQLADRLDDSNMVFWAYDELVAYFQEALRSWNAHANYWRDSFTFASGVDTTFYDFTDTAALPNTLRPLTVTDQDIFELIEYHVLEPLTDSYPLAWSGSLQFTMDDILNAVQRRCDEILSTTGCAITRSTVAAISGRTALDDNILDIRRLAWLPGSGPYVNTPILPGDVFGEGSFNPGYLAAAAGTPSVYMQSSQPPLSLEVDTQPAVAGNYELLTVNAGSALSTVAATIMPIPDDFTWIIKWGALADLLNRETDAKDESRSVYCETRYRQGLSLLRTAPALLSLLIGTTPLEICSIDDADHYTPGWQAAPTGMPTVALVAGLNMIALSAIPDAAYGLTASVVENAPIPVDPGDDVQMARDDYDAMLDEAQHIASFKMGGREFMDTLPLHERFLKQAAIYNQKLNALGQYSDLLYAMSQWQERTNPRLESAKVVDNG